MAYTEHDKLPTPKDTGKTIWRYLDFTQFISIIEREALWFTAADQLDDPIEGGFTMPDLEYAVEQGRSMGWEFDEDEFMEMVQSTPNHFVKDLYINCWHKNEYESAAMWQQYSQQNSGIAIRSTINRFIDALDVCDGDIRDDCDEYNVHISPVEYKNFRKDNIREGLMLKKYLYKRKSYRHEKEVRALFQLNDIIEVETERAEKEDLTIQNPGQPWQQYPKTEPYASILDEPMPPGVYVCIDLDDLIEKIFVAPDAPEWIETTVEKIVDRYGWDSDVVEKSSLKSTLLK